MGSAERTIDRVFHLKNQFLASTITSLNMTKLHYETGLVLPFKRKNVPDREHHQSQEANAIASYYQVMDRIINRKI